MLHISQPATLPTIGLILAHKRATTDKNRRDLTELCTSILKSTAVDPENSPATRPTATLKFETISRQLDNFPTTERLFIPRITEIFEKVLQDTYDHPADISIIYDEAVFIRDHIVTHIKEIPGAVPLLTYYLMSCKKAATVALRALAAASSLDAESDIREATPTPSLALPISYSAEPPISGEPSPVLEQHSPVVVTPPMTPNVPLQQAAPESPVHVAPAPARAPEQLPLPRPFGASPSRSAFSSPQSHHSPLPPKASQRAKSLSPPEQRPIVVISPLSTEPIAAPVPSSPLLQPSSLPVVTTESPKLVQTLSHHAYTVVSPRTSFDRMYSSIYSLEKANGLCTIIRNTLRVATWIVTFITPLFIVMGIWWACSKSTCFSKGRVSQEPPLLVNTAKATRA